ncbi:unnamed protein product [Heterobilharzia americana]|nr:unnamed protein product [Heterobilharzia americana]
MNNVTLMLQSSEKSLTKPKIIMAKSKAWSVHLQQKFTGRYSRCSLAIILTTYILFYATIYELSLEETEEVIFTTKLLSMKKFDISQSAETCRSICNNITSIPKNKVEYLKPIGNLWKIVHSEVHRHSRNNTIFPHLVGGSWIFKDESFDSSDKCTSVPESGVAIVFVCRDRWMQLNITLSVLIPILQKQHLCCRIFVIEQAGNGMLNKARLLNSGFLEARKRFNFNCIVFHDADLVPLNDKIPYGCDFQTRDTPVHLSVGVSKWNYVLPYIRLIGGVLKISNEHFISINGYSNSYWGWGGEDDDLEKRLKALRIKYVHLDKSLGRYVSVPHEEQATLSQKSRRILLNDAVRRMHVDGLNSLSYRVVNISEKPYFTHITVSLGDQF